MTTMDVPVESVTGTDFLWLEVAGTKCQQECTHCYSDSGPSGDFGSMTPEDWRRVIDEAAEMGVRQVQMIGGEPTLYPHLVELIQHAIDRGLRVEIFSNLAHVTDDQWRAFELPGVSLATSYYSDDPEQHVAIVGRPTHRNIRANIAKARDRGIELRAGVIDLGDGQRVDQARADLVDLGVPRIGYDRLREVGRGGGAGPAALCGGCGAGVAAVGSDGQVTPCVMARSTVVGNVREDGLAAAVAGMPAARRELVAAGMPDRSAAACQPDGGQCYPSNCDPRW